MRQLWDQRVRGWAALAACLLVATSGCKPEPLKLVPLSGKVTVNGKPADRANVYFTPLAPAEGKPILPSAVSAADGTFRVTTLFPDDGIPPGEYAVTVVWPRYYNGGDEEVAGPDRLKGRYDDAQKPALRYTVKEGETEMPRLDLQLP